MCEWTVDVRTPVRMRLALALPAAARNANNKQIDEIVFLMLRFLSFNNYPKAQYQTESFLQRINPDVKKYPVC